MKIISINGKPIEDDPKLPEGQNVPHHTDRWYNRQERSWVVQLKDKYDNQIDSAVYVYSKQEEINAENKFKEVIKMTKEYKYQRDVTTTIYDDHDCIIWTAYDKESQDFEDVLILDIPGKYQKIMNDTEGNREYYLGLIDKYLMGY